MLVGLSVVLGIVALLGAWWSRRGRDGEYEPLAFLSAALCLFGHTAGREWAGRVAASWEIQGS